MNEHNTDKMPAVPPELIRPGMVQMLTRELAELTLEYNQLLVHSAAQDLLVADLKQTLRDLHLWALTFVVRSYTESVEGQRLYERVQELLGDAHLGGKDE